MKASYSVSSEAVQYYSYCILLVKSKSWGQSKFKERGLHKSVDTGSFLSLRVCVWGGSLVSGYHFREQVFEKRACVCVHGGIILTIRTA